MRKASERKAQRKQNVAMFSPIDGIATPTDYIVHCGLCYTLLVRRNAIVASAMRTNGKITLGHSDING